MKVTTNKFGMMDVVRYGRTYYQITDIIAKRCDNEWYYDIHECFGDNDYCDVPEHKLRDLTNKQKIDYEYRVMV